MTTISNRVRQDDGRIISMRAAVASVLALGSAGFVAAGSAASAGASAPACTSVTSSSNGPTANGDGSVSQVFVGENATLTVPAGVTSMAVDVCGAQGGGYGGGWGGRVAATFTVVPGQPMSIVAGTSSGSIGAGGWAGSANGAGTGGGYSSVAASGDNVFAGGGGGAGGTNGNGYYGGSGGAGGQQATSGWYGSGAKNNNAGGGGGASANGAGYGGGGADYGNGGGMGGYLAGGAGGNGLWGGGGGGGGGGGYYGGGGGGAGYDDNSYYSSGGGGGGGASHVSSGGAVTGASYATGVRAGDGAVVVTYTPAKAAQTITFDTLPDKTYGDSPVTLAATATSGLPVTYTVGSNDACSVSSATLTLTGAGSCSVTAHQVGDGSYAAAPDVTHSFAIAKQGIAVTVTGLQTYGPTIAFSYTHGTLPDHISLAGTVTCSTVDGGHPVGAALSAGDHTIDGASCSGLTASDATDYVVGYTGGAYSVQPNTSLQSPTETVSGASLGFVSAPGAVLPPTTTLNGVDEMTPAFALPLDIGDATGSGNGWNVALSATPFTDSHNRTLGALYQTAEATPACDAETTCTLATDAASLIKLGLLGYGTSTLVATADTGTGMGDQSLSPTFKLAVPANTFAGNYTSTWTVSLNSAPH